VADEHDRDARTEPASAQRLRRAREEGQLPVGHDAVLVAGLAAATAALVALAGPIRAGLTDLLAAAAGGLRETPFSTLPALSARPVLAVLAVCAAAGLASAAATLVQTGGGFWGHLPAPDLTRLFSPQRLARIASREFLLDLALALAKVAAVAAAAVWGVGDELARIPRLLGAAPAEQLAATFRLLGAAARPVLGAGLVLAAAEWGLTRWRFAKKMRMTKEEAKRECKEDEGDPLLRGRRKQRHRELVRNRAKAEVPRADALVVNPTHVAVALRYRRDEGRAPRVTAKGKGELAEFMRELARENGVPIVQDVPLARLLYRKVKVGREIPAQTYKAVAAVLAFVYRLTGRSPGARA
jgi:flagellar biosynthetic protein FlhB